ncbi:MAG: methyltransferase domain-containing protein, partial [Planctomycetes bacterium]|nr:methyltransferase domain-containing protein [Planctomycetota bacterium]
MSTALTYNTKSSAVVLRCQSCGGERLQSVLFLGYLPPVNKMREVGERPREEPAFPAELLFCEDCALAQLGLVVDPTILFPPEYPYTSSTTKILRENFAELYSEASGLVPLSPEDLIVDIGSNDGNLLSNFSGKHRVLGVTPEDIGKIAIARGIPTLQSYFGTDAVDLILREHSQARIITATNVFAHMEDIHAVIENILRLLASGGVFISESHYLLSLVETLQYDTIYHEHLRYYSLHSLSHLLEAHGLEVFHARRIPTHGGSVRVYAARKGERNVEASVRGLLEEEAKLVLKAEQLRHFASRVVLAKMQLYPLLESIKKSGGRIYGVGAPSRASTLIHYVGLDEGIIDKVMEIGGSHKIGK